MITVRNLQVPGGGGVKGDVKRGGNIKIRENKPRRFPEKTVVVHGEFRTR